MTYKNVFVGGTFDRIHKGHESLFKKALEEGEHVTVGLTSDQFIQNHKPTVIVQPYEKRKSALINFLDSKRWLERATIIPIDDPFEPAASSAHFDAIVVTADNKVRGHEINAKRLDKNLDGLVLLEVPIVKAEDGEPISSTRIKSGVVDPDGKLVMPEHLRNELSQPIGKLLVGDQIGQTLKSHASYPIITVGDVTTKTILDLGIKPILAVIDLQAGRMPYEGSKPVLDIDGVRVFRVKSGPGSISQEALAVIKDLKNTIKAGQSTVILVDGEEDLLAIPVMQYAPLGSILYYGQPAHLRQGYSGQGGVVEVEITIEAQKKAGELLDKFTA